MPYCRTGRLYPKDRRILDSSPARSVYVKIEKLQSASTSEKQDALDTEFDLTQHFFAARLYPANCITEISHSQS